VYSDPSVGHCDDKGYVCEDGLCVDRRTEEEKYADKIEAIKKDEREAAWKRELNLGLGLGLGIPFGLVILLCVVGCIYPKPEWIQQAEEQRTKKSEADAAKK